MSSIKLWHPTKKIKASVHVPGSKSESNRLLILNALANNQLQIENLSPARDTVNLQKILQSNEPLVDVLDAGTSMRFLTAYYAATNQAKTITGTSRMKERPIAPLVNALSEIGFDVRYKEKEGFPPLEIVPLKGLDKLDNEVSIEGNVSSQFITALLLIAPALPNGLKVNFTTELTSKPYIEMTLAILGHFGVTYTWGENFIAIPKSVIKSQKYSVGGDWSSASYWYSVAFLADEAEILLEGLHDDYTQGDRAIADWMKHFGIRTEFTKDGALIRKITPSHPKMIKLSFKDNPDLAQTMAAMFAGRNVICNFTNIDSLKIKETDRIAALQNELKKVNTRFDYSEMYDLYQLKGEFKPSTEAIQTYGDHRMAMSFAPLALFSELQIEEPSVVEKSYPDFWKEMQKAGFEIK